MSKYVARISAALLLAVVCSPRAHALTLSDVETRIRYNVNDTDTTLPTYSDTVLDLWINEAQRTVVDETWCVRASTSRVLSSGTTYYSLPDDVINVYQVTFQNASGNTDELDEISERVLFDTNPDYEKSYTGVPSEYFIRTSTYGVDALEISYLPVPTASSTGTVRVYYYAQATDLSSDSDVPFEGYRHLYQYHDTLWLYVTYRIKLLEGKTTEADVYHTLYESKIARMISNLGQRPNYNPSVKATPK